MRRAGAGLIVAVLALTGCKSADSKSGDDKSSAGAVARAKKDKEKDAAAKGTTPTWLITDDVAKLPGAGTDLPKGTGTITNDPRTFSQEELSGRVVDPDGKPARGIGIRVEEVGAPTNAYDLDTAVYIQTNGDGYFRSPGKPGKAYELTAAVTTPDGRKLVGVVQAKVPDSKLLITLREDLAPSGPFPPAPKPSEKVGDTFPPPRVPPKPAPDGAYSPGLPGGATPPATLGGGAAAPVAPKPPASGGQFPPPDPTLFPGNPNPAVKPENVADGPKDPLFRAPPASIPGPGAAPPVPPLPPVPPSYNSPGGGRSSGAAAPVPFALVDALDRTWDLDCVKPGTLVLVEFMDSKSPACREYLPVGKDLQSRYGASGLQLAGVICDNLPQKDRAAAAANYGRDNNLNYALYVEPGANGSVCDKFGVKDLPYAVLLDSTGRVLWRGHAGDRARLEAAIKQNLAK